MRILNLEPDFFNPDALKILKNLGSVVDGPLSELKEDISNFDIIIVRLAYQLNETFLARAKNLKIIVTATTGLNHIDLLACKNKNITVLSLLGEREFLNTIHATAEHTMALLLSLTRKIPFAHLHVMNGQWQRDAFRGVELSGKKIGIIGLGRLGAKVARYAQAFGMDVCSYDTNSSIRMDGVTNVTYESLASSSDIVSIHIPSTHENKHFIGKKFFEHIKPGSLLLNTSRGDVLDQTQLLLALKSGDVSGAALDVLEEEYNGSIKNSPLIEYAKLHENLIITPHIGGATIDSMDKTELFLVQKLEKFVRQL